MRQSLLLPGFIGFTVLLFACDRVASHDERSEAASPAEVALAEDAVKQVEEDMGTAFKARDAEKLASFYADDAVAAMPGRPAASGRAAIAKMMGGDLSDPAFALTLENAKTSASAAADMAYTRGTFRVTYTDPATRKPANMSGNYLTVFRKQADGSWKAVEDIASEGAPRA